LSPLGGGVLVRHDIQKDGGDFLEVEDIVNGLVHRVGVDDVKASVIGGHGGNQKKVADDHRKRGSLCWNSKLAPRSCKSMLFSFLRTSTPGPRIYIGFHAESPTWNKQMAEKKCFPLHFIFVYFFDAS